MTSYTDKHLAKATEEGAGMGDGELAELWRWFASAKPEFDRQERLRSMASEMLDLLIEVLPYMETAESDEAYKAGAVAKVTAKIRAAISKAEGR